MRRTGIAVSVLVIASCGGSSTGPAFGPDGGALPPSVEQACAKAASAPCGGNIVGTWAFVGKCDMTMTQQELAAKYGPSVSCVVSADLKISGFAKFRADGVLQGDEKSLITASYSNSCFGNFGETCQGEDPSCVSAGDACNCTTVPYDGQTIGTYAVSGTMYYARDLNGNDAGTRQFCVQGNTLSLFTPSDTVGGSGVVVLSRAPDNAMPDIDASVPDARPDTPTDRPNVDAGPDVTVDSARRDALDAGVDVRVDTLKPDINVVEVSRVDAPAMALDAAPIDAVSIDAVPAPL